jgi:hypothetical protein
VPVAVALLSQCLSGRQSELYVPAITEGKLTTFERS